MSLLTHTPAQIIQQLLIDLGLGAASGEWQTFWSHQGDFPGTHDNTLCVYTTEGPIHGRAHVSGETLEHKGIQIRVRGSSDLVAHTRANAIATAFDGAVLRTAVVIEGRNYLVQALTRTGPILPLGPESPSSARRIYTINFVASLWEI